MSIRQLSYAAILAVVAGTPAAAGEVPSAAVDSAAPAAPAVAPPAAPAGHQVVIGPSVRDAQGVEGRIHTVAKGDTLWDISGAYLGEPWLWPSLWQANQAEVKDPHWIYPGQKLFVSGSGIRPIGDDEAARMAAGSGGALSPSGVLPMTFASIEFTGFVATERLDERARVIAGMPDRMMNATGDHVTIGLGQGAVNVGDQLTFFRVTGDATDPYTRHSIGKVVNVLGWGTVTDVGPDFAGVHIDTAVSEIMVRDGVYPRALVNTQVHLTPGPGGIDGDVVALPSSRTIMGEHDVVYLDLGSANGVAVGNAFELYRPRWGNNSGEFPGADGRRIDDLVIGRVIVVETQPGSAVGVVTASTYSIEKGDRFRSVVH